MANNYYQATGCLQLKAITPVINALFGVFQVKKFDDKLADIRQCENDISYSSVVKTIQSEMGMKFEKPIEDIDVVDVLIAMATKLGKLDEAKKLLLEEDGTNILLDPDEDANLQLLFDLAIAMDDGHGLELINMSGAWTSIELGGTGEFISKHFSTYADSAYDSAYMGSRVSQYIEDNKLLEAANMLVGNFNATLSNIVDATKREEITRMVLAAMAEK